MEIDLNSLDAKDRYKLAIGSVIPRPIAWVSTKDANGVRNLAPYSFFTVACTSPLIFVIFPLRYKREAEFKDTTLNILDTREAVINIANEDLLTNVNATSARLARDIDEFELAGVVAEKSVFVKPDRVAASPISFECILNKHVILGDDDGGSDALFLEVVHARIFDHLINQFRIDHEQLNPIARLAGTLYTTIGRITEIQRPN